MKIATNLVPVLSVLFSTLVTPPTLQATTIQFAAIDLADANPGQDLWRYDYTVNGSFLQSWFFDVYFDANLYGTLSAASAPNADWDVIILQQPNPVNVPPFDQGIFDAGARTDNPSLSGAFSVSFINLGAGTPGSQRFEVFDAETNLVDSGFTQEVRGIPEPATTALSLIGLVVCAILYHLKVEIQR